MPNCCVVTCKNRSEIKNYKNDGVTYHIFPKDGNIKEKWMDATGRGPNWFPVQRSVICSDHFQEECFQLHNKSRRLFDWAIPTLKICQIVSSDFNCVTCGHKTIPTSTNQCKNQRPEEPSNILENFKLRQKINRYESMLNKKKTLIKKLQKRTSRYQKRIKKLEDILKELNAKNAEQAAN